MNAGLGLIFSVLIARSLGPSGNGHYALIILLASTLGQFLNIDIPAANVYFIGRREFSVKDALKTNLYLSLILGLAGVAIGLPIIIFLKQTLFSEIDRTLLSLGLFLYFISLSNTFLSSILQGIQDFKNFNKILLLSAVLNILFGFIFLYLLDWGLLGAVMATIAGKFLSLCFAFFKVYDEARFNIRLDLSGFSGIRLSGLKLDLANLMRVIDYGWKAGLSNLIAFFNYKADILLLGFFLGVAPVGIYAVAVQLVEKLWLFSKAVSTVVFPRSSELYRDKSEFYRSDLTTTVCKVVLALTSVAALTLGLVAFWFIPYAFGTSFNQAVSVVWILLPGIVLISVSRVLANDIAARGHPEINLYSSLIAMIANVILNLLLIPSFGVFGAAVATTIAYTINAVFKLSINAVFKLLVYRRYTMA